MNDRERRVLARIEQELQRSDPDLVRMFAHLGSRRRVSGPALILFVGLAVMVFGSATVSVAVALLGIVISTVAVVAAYRRPLSSGSSGTA